MKNIQFGEAERLTKGRIYKYGNSNLDKFFTLYTLYANLIKRAYYVHSLYVQMYLVHSEDTLHHRKWCPVYTELLLFIIG